MSNLKNKFTPGPWVYGDASENGQYIWDPKGERIVAEAYPDWDQDFEANAHLIAAAPEMYALLLKNLNEWKQYDMANDDNGATGKARIKLMKDIQKLLVKARGGK
jgi:hypothetical protein